ncbi:hypothetical protein NDU88_003644 [Pleurodeles waltl]|uniref:Uncharacterized protein n=1 Tax=Pleurodeles waltl TaxID=8319 RepID=A0AAV7KZ33_PLEWA|nr:hypothetical protein NDU88_003644 [Pleurodeles waltl]
MSITQASSRATKSASTVVPATPRGSKRALVRPTSVPPTPAKDLTIPPPAKVKKGTACSKGKELDPPSKASSKTPAARAKVPAASDKVRKGQKSQGKALQVSAPAGEDLVATIRTDSPATCTTVSTASILAASTATCTAAATTTVRGSIPSGQPSEAAGEGLVPLSTTGSTSTCTTASPASIPAASTAHCTTDSRTTTNSSSPSVRPSEAAGDGLEAPTTTGSTPTCIGTTTSLQP